VGFIGSHIVDNLLQKGYEPYVLDDLSSCSVNKMKKNLNNPHLQVIKVNISQIHERVKVLKGLDVVFHEAAISSVLFQ